MSYMWHGEEKRKRWQVSLVDLILLLTGAGIAFALFRLAMTMSLVYHRFALTETLFEVAGILLGMSVGTFFGRQRGSTDGWLNGAAAGGIFGYILGVAINLIRIALG